jgi:hypothetical protein
MEFEIRSFRLRKTVFQCIHRSKLFKELITFCIVEKIPIRTEDYHPINLGVNIRGTNSYENFIGIWRYLYERKRYKTLRNYISFTISHGYKDYLFGRYEINELFKFDIKYFEMIVKMANVKNITYEFIDSFVKYGKKRNLMETLLSIEKPKWDEMKEIVKKIKINICDVSYDDIDIWKIYKRIDKLKNIILSRST